ncbi:MAG TPA: terminase TerL endonuclease subunit [Sedimentisphaerales bacterium]|nr:terminase TerL endonuclease subunit [Sedimentisphaerales bacterium]
MAGKSKASSSSYRPRQSYLASDPEKRAKQLANLTSRWKTKPLAAAEELFVKRPNEFTNDIAGFAETHFYLPETRKPIVLLSWEQDIFSDLFYCPPDLRPTLALLGMPKKSGKSTIAAIVALWYLVSKQFAEIYIMGPDLEQGQLVVFAKICKAVRLNPYLRKTCTITGDSIKCSTTDGVIKVLPCNSTAPGLNPDLVIFDELWRFTSAEAKRAIDEMTNVPGKHSLILVVTYAGYEDSEDTHLWRWYRQGMDMAEGKAEADARFYFLWRTDYEDIPWVTERYLASQRRRLSESTYLRFHENAWVAAETAFISAEQIQSCTKPGLLRGRTCHGPVVLGVDIGLKHDCCGVVVVGQSVRPGSLAVYDHALFVPQKGQAVDLETTVEAYLLELWQKYLIGQVGYDPYQFARSAQALAKKGLPMQEYPQTQGNCVSMTETLQALIVGGKLELYESAELRTHLKNCTAKETGRGMRIVKSGQSKKIDLAVALAIAVACAVQEMLVGSGGVGDLGHALDFVRAGISCASDTVTPQVGGDWDLED